MQDSLLIENINLTDGENDYTIEDSASTDNLDSEDVNTDTSENGISEPEFSETTDDEQSDEQSDEPSDESIEDFESGDNPPEDIDISENEISEPEFSETTDDDQNDDAQNIGAETENGGKVISVDDNFDGNLESAISAANNGDVVLLGNTVYYTDGITLDKDITIDGQENSVINGNGTAESIIRLTPGASGATIQDVELTNANNGINGYGASNVRLQNLEVHDIGISQTDRYGANNTAIGLSHAEGLEILDSRVYNIGKKGVGIGDTNGARISGLSVQEVNLQGQHSQSHDAAGIKFYNTHNVTVADSYFSNINANHIWNDTSSGTAIEGNVIENVGSNFVEPSFDSNVAISGIYNEKSPDSRVSRNQINTIDDSEFTAFNATEFTSESLSLADDNSLSSVSLGTTDYWANEQAEKLIATTTNPDEANFDIFAEDYYNHANIG